MAAFSNEGNEFPIYNKTITPAVAVTRRRFVGHDDEQVTALNAKVQGVSLVALTAADITDGILGSICTFGSVLVETGGTFSKGDPITNDTTGRAILGNAANMHGIAEAASGAAGEFVPIFLVGAASGVSSGGLVYKDTQLTATNIKALAATNIQLAAAPGAGFAIVPVAVHLFLKHGGTDYVQVAGTDALALKYNGGVEISELGTEAQMTTLLEAAADDSLYVNIEADFVPEANKAVDLDNNGASEITTGDGTLSVRFYYRTVPMAAFS